MDRIAHRKRVTVVVLLMTMAALLFACTGQNARSDERAREDAVGIVAALARHDLGEVDYRFAGALTDEDYERLKSEVPKDAGIDPIMYTASIVKRIGKDRLLLRVVQDRTSPSPKFSASVEMISSPAARHDYSSKDAWVVASVRFQR